jgi:calcineurin-like phosphoesterase family protein
MRMSNYFFTADEHYGHFNIIKYTGRTYTNVDEMNHDMIIKNNEIVTNDDVVVHVGDFTLAGRDFAQSIIKQLNGQQVFVLGSHDSWMQKKGSYLFERTIEEQHVVCCHYPMYSWPRSHYGSWLLYGHHHGRFSVPCKALDVGVDTNNFYPYSFTKIKMLMEQKPVTPGTIIKKY